MPGIKSSESDRINNFIGTTFVTGVAEAYNKTN